jgi:hypothetical protein
MHAEFQPEVKYWAFINHLQDYKIYLIVIKMFILEFLSSLPQPLRNNPWPKDLTKHNIIDNAII